MGEFPGTGVLHDLLLNAHGSLYKHGWISRLTIIETRFNIGMDHLLLCIAIFYLYAGSFLVYQFLKKTKST